MRSAPKALGPVAFELGEEGEADGLGFAALLGEADELGALVGGVGVALEVAEAVEVVDDLPHRLLGEARQGGELGEAHAVAVDEAEDAAVGRADVVDARLLEVSCGSRRTSLRRRGPSGRAG